MLRVKGRLVTKRNVRRLPPDEKMKRAAASARKILGDEQFNNLQEVYKSFGEIYHLKRRKLEDGMIMTLLLQNLSFLEIRATFGCGNSRIMKIKKIMENPSLLELKRQTPKHAISNDDLDALKTHLSSFDTEDGYPFAHRRPRKFFIQQGLTWYKI